MDIVVAIDGLQSAKTALEHIYSAKYGSEVRFHLVHVIVPGFADAPTPGIPDVVAEEKAEEQSVLDFMEKQLKEKLSSPVSKEMPTGEIAEVIAEACKKYSADEVIVPSHARHGFSRLWFGSVADEIVDAAPCTTIVLKMTNQAKV